MVRIGGLSQPAPPASAIGAYRATDIRRMMGDRLRADRCEGCGQRAQSVRGDPVVGPFASLFARGQAGFDEQLHVVRDGRLAQPDGLSHVADAGLSPVGRGDHRQQLDPGGVAESLEHPSKGLGRLIADHSACHGRAAGGQFGGLEQRQGSRHTLMMPDALTFVDERVRIHVSTILNVRSWRWLTSLVFLWW